MSWRTGTCRNSRRGSARSAPAGNCDRGCACRSRCGAAGRGSARRLASRRPTVARAAGRGCSTGAGRNPALSLALVGPCGTAPWLVPRVRRLTTRSDRARLDRPAASARAAWAAAPAATRATSPAASASANEKLSATAMAPAIASSRKPRSERIPSDGPSAGPFSGPGASGKSQPPQAHWKRLWR